MLLIELDWSITYIDSINLVLRTLVDKGDNRAASFLGRMLLEQKDYKTSVRILDLADKLDDVIIDKVISIIKDAQCPENIINSFVNIIKKHARLDNSYANYQIALAYKEGIGVPQDNMMAFVHITMASARVYGHERDKLIKLRDELRGVLNEEEISNAQKIIRKNYVN
jgi:TPR repeat protein